MPAYAANDKLDVTAVDDFLRSERHTSASVRDREAPGSNPGPRHSLKPAGLPLIRFHDLRHTAATLWFRSGVNPKIVQETLGHSRVAITLDTYSHMIPDLQVETARVMDELFSPRPVADSSEPALAIAPTAKSCTPEMEAL